MYKNLTYVICLGLVLSMSPGTTNADIIAYWPFDEGTGNVAKDVIGGFDAQLTGIDWVAGQSGGFAAESSRGSDQILVGTGPTPTTKDISLAWWMVDKYDSYHTMMNKGTDSSQAGYYILLRPTSEDSPLRFRIGGFQAYGGWGGECRVPQGACKDGEWVHVVCTYDYASDTATIYLNGNLVPNGNYNPKTGIAGPTGYCQGVNDPTQPLYIVGQRETFGGIVDEVAIWDHALSANEVMSVFTLGPLALDPRMAGRPSPADGATDIPREAILGWSPGESAITHDVYLGTVFDDVNSASRSNPKGVLVSQKQNTPIYDHPVRLDFGQTYYWRIDEANAPTATPVKGITWSFTTEPVAYPVAGQTITVTASSAEPGQGPENTINGSGLANDLHSDEFTAMWTTALGATGPAWIRYEFDRLLKLHQMWVWNHNGLLESAIGLGCKDVTIEYSTNGTDYTALGTTHEFTKAPGKAGYAHNTAVDFAGVTAKYVRLTINSNWGGILSQYGLSEVRFFSIPVLAREPNPASSAKNVSVNATLSWRAGREAAKHNVYLSTDQQAVTDGTAPVVSVTSPTYATSLDLASTYYWRIDEVNDVETPTTWQGDLWSLATQEYLAVDDFESYNDTPAGQAGSKLVYATWADGFGTTTNGSTVGYTAAFQPSMEKTTIYDGKQSVPLFYNNTTAGFSEITANVAFLQGGQDWSKHGIKGLTLRFYGDPANALQQLYVKINGTKVTYDGNAENLQRAGWQMWYVDLASLGVNLGNVTTLTIGLERLGTLGGQGKVLLDAIRLYSYDRKLTTPVDPGTANLQAQYQFEGNANDSSGKSRNGTLQGGPLFVTGHAGQAIGLDGVDDYVNIDGYKGILADAAGVQQALTLSAWIKVTTDGEIITWGTNAGGQRMSFRVDTVLRVEHGSGNVRGTNGPSLRDDQWHHVAATVPQGGRMMDVRLYVDGADVTPVSTTTAAFNLKANLDVRIGMGGPTGGRFLTGLVDDARMYDRALSPEEIAWLAGQTLPVDKPF